MEIITLTYKSTNYFLVRSAKGWLLVDAGWPGTLSQFLQLLSQNNIQLSDINYLVITHFHPDHAGLAQNLKEYGIRLLLHSCQTPYVGKLNAFFKKNPGAQFKDITFDHTITLSGEESRSFLKEIGIEGVMLPTPGHSDDSISLIIDHYCAFTGDLPALYLAEAYDDPVVSDSWDSLMENRVRMIYPAHGNVYEIPEQYLYL